MKNIFEDMGPYGSSWSLTDLYEGHKAKIEAVIKSGDEFCAEWGAKKEIHYVEVTRVDGAVSVSVEVLIDEISGAADTLLWIVTGRNAYAGSGREAAAKMHDLDLESDEERIDDLMAEVVMWIEDDYQETFKAEASGLQIESWEQLEEVIDTLVDKAEKASNLKWEELQDIVREGINWSFSKREGEV